MVDSSVTPESRESMHSWEPSHGRVYTELWQYWAGLFISPHGIDSTLEGGPGGPMAGDSSMEMPGISRHSWKTNS